MVLIHRASGQALERAGGEAQTTNNRMEMMAAIAALASLKRTGFEVMMCTDSKYLIDCCTKWIHGWKRKGWTKADGKPVKNVDLLQELEAALAPHRVRWVWVPGHSGEPGNERADALANLAMDQIVRGVSAEYENRLVWTEALP
jgi:ribonuclease HI